MSINPLMKHFFNWPITDSSSLREKVEYKHALFEEFGSTRFAYFESGQSVPAASLISVILVTIVALWIK